MLTYVVDDDDDHVFSERSARIARMMWRCRSGGSLEMKRSCTCVLRDSNIRRTRKRTLEHASTHTHANGRKYIKFATCRLSRVAVVILIKLCARCCWHDRATDDCVCASVHERARFRHGMPTLVQKHTLAHASSERLSLAETTLLSPQCNMNQLCRHGYSPATKGTAQPHEWKNKTALMWIKLKI